MRNPSEHQEQAAVVAWLEAHNVEFFAVPNGGRRDARQASTLKAEGVRPGVADLIIVRTPPLALEMKARIGGRVSPAQAAWGQRVSARGWVWHVSPGAEDAIAWLVKTGVGRG